MESQQIASIRGNFLDDHVNPPFIGISGIIGAGKTTLTRHLAERLGIPAYYEPVIDNELLTKFYSDMKRYGFQLQIDLLANRFAQHQQIVWSGAGGISDRTIYEDAIFARVLVGAGNMTEGEYNTYKKMFSRLANFMRRPTLIIHLDVSPDESMRRIRARARLMESGITLEYLTLLYNEYNTFIDAISHTTPVIRVDWSDYTAVDTVIDDIQTKLNRANITQIART